MKKPAALFKLSVIFILLNCSSTFTNAQAKSTSLSYVVAMDTPSNHRYHVVMTYTKGAKGLLNFNMCTWTPGFYAIIDFAGAVSNFKAKDARGNSLGWTKSSASTWQVKVPAKEKIVISYDVKAENPFIGNINLNAHYGYIIPGAVLMYLNAELRHPLTVSIKPYPAWKPYVATGLDHLPGQVNTFYAPDFDVLYDSPFLMGELDVYPSFNLKGKPVQVVGYDLGNFDSKQFLADLQKITMSGSNIIGDVPYSHYTFLAVGNKGGGYGGIEHLNSVSMILNTAGLFNPERKNTFYSFLAHEYFHLYNVKRIRPIELGPFNYAKENYTNLLWVSEGFTDYYSYLILRRAGLMTSTQVLENYQEHIQSYENKPGHLHQSAAEASRGIWAIGGNPFSRTADELGKTISVYDKGCALGMMLDLAIRHETQNRSSLDDVMKFLYKKYYQSLKRGFTDTEFQQACESFAGKPLTELFEYVTTVKPVNYPKYLAYAGLGIDTAVQTYPGPYLGIDAGVKDSTLRVNNVAYGSPAWNAGINPGDKILDIDGRRADQQSFELMKSTKKSGDKVQIHIERAKQVQQYEVILGVKKEKSFAISPLKQINKLQSDIYNSWLRGTQ